MKRYFIFMAIILGMIAPSVSAQTAAKKKVAVYMTGNDVQDSYKKVIGAKLVSAITATNEYAAVERTADFLAALSSEHDFQTSGEVQDSQIARLGQKFGVRYVVVADVSEVFEELFVSARLINVESALVEKAFDANAPAESMAQLIDISTKVAKGLLQGSTISTGRFSSSPINLALCVSYDNKISYITSAEWNKMSESDKVSYTKKGICLMYNGNAIIVSMHDSDSGDWHYARMNNVPTKAQLLLMYNNRDALNSALRLFGGEPLYCEKNGGKYYWAYEQDSTNSGVSMTMYDGSFGSPAKTYTGNINRPVYKIGEL